jgi:hypothetical protein
MWKSLKRWPVLLALLVILSALAVSLVWLPYGSRVTRANCERIQAGMTEDEVYAILGEAWTDSLLDAERPSDRDWDRALALQQKLPQVQYLSLWMGSNVGLFVGFDSERRVALTMLCTDQGGPRSWLPGRVLRRLRARYGW